MVYRHDKKMKLTGEAGMDSVGGLNSTTQAAVAAAPYRQLARRRFFYGKL
jgi:hypothetical protein